MGSSAGISEPPRDMCQDTLAPAHKSIKNGGSNICSGRVSASPALCVTTPRLLHTSGRKVWPNHLGWGARRFGFYITATAKVKGWFLSTSAHPGRFRLILFWVWARSSHQNGPSTGSFSYLGSLYGEHERLICSPLFADKKLPVFISPCTDMRVKFIDAMSVPWMGLGIVYAFPPLKRLPAVFHKIHKSVSQPQSNSPHIRYACLVHPGVQDKRRVSEIDLSQPGHETAFWWRHNGPVTSQLTDPIKWPIYPLKLIGIYVHIDTNNKESLTQRCRRSTNVQLCLIFLYIYLMDGMHYFVSRITGTASP